MTSCLTRDVTRSLPLPALNQAIVDDEVESRAGTTLRCNTSLYLRTGWSGYAGSFSYPAQMLNLMNLMNI
ncbi:hypothetical protein F2Q69_00016978 [Brassica cretica]|uniref:Uncharacterized protein n=1 Tax=Brassica cretica TaxID=69181 RepID=A0A8S9R749_BRACR|nr:hypothetical protein F2Q69_00016978 [Brassica cretica]